MESQKPRSRRELRELEKNQSRNQKSGLKITAHLPRMALVGLLACLTVVAPLSGIVSPDLSIASPKASFETGETLLSAIADGTRWSNYDSDLNAVPVALARVAEASQLSGCMSRENAASGDASIVPQLPDLLWPMSAGSYTMSSSYGMRIHPVTGSRTMHEGFDWAARRNTPIYAIADGTVDQAGMVGGTGLIRLKHELDGTVFYSVYLHMYPDGIYVKAGEKVKVGDLIGGVGNTGRSTGAHLHFEIRNEKKSSTDPMAWMKRHGAVYINRSCD